MKNNPVYKREMLVRSRSFRIPLIIMIFNGILALVALLNMYQSIAQVKVSGSVTYENFLQLYTFVAALEFMMLMFIMPALTSASISGERERHTLELMFTTKIRPVDIVIGKLASAFTHLMILVFSSLPVLMLTFIYGSISSQDLFLLLFSYVTVALYCGSLGIFASSLMKRSTFSNVITYGIMLVLVVGTYMLNVFLLRISETEINMMVLPGGMPGTTHLGESLTIQEGLAYAAQEDLWVAAICAAPSVLGENGLLHGRKYTCYPGFENDEKYHGTYTAAPLQQDGKIITANGAGNAMTFALYLLAALQGEEKALEVGRSIQMKL